VEPKLVCEVQFDRMMRHEWGGSFRHATAFLRWRPDKDPKECTFAQF
jgi:ATP-dependent DNA ligase